MLTPLKIIQWNCSSATAHSVLLKKLLIDTNCDVALLSETRYKPGQTINFPGYQLIRKDQRSGKWGVAILVSDKLAYEQITFDSRFSKKIEMCGINLLLHNKKISIISLYRPNKVRVS